MYPKLLLILVVGTLVVTAGCVEGFDSVGLDGDDGVDDTDGPDADDNAASGDRDGRLIENRTAALVAAGSYTAVWELESSTEGEVVGLMAYTTAVDYGSERSSFGMRQESEGEVHNDFETYHADGTTYTRYGAGEEATYNVNEAPFEPGNTVFSVESHVADGDLEEFSVAGTETYDGVTVTRYERAERPAWLAVQSRTDEEFTWTQFDYVVLVDEQGLVRYESWGGEGVDGEDVAHAVEFRYSLTDVGTTVLDEPEWAGTARSESEQ
jgi:hypothetical protein